MVKNRCRSRDRYGLYFRPLGDSQWRLTLVDRLRALLDEQDCLCGLVSRDATAVDVELCSQLGYHFVWLDLEHSPHSLADAVQFRAS